MFCWIVINKKKTQVTHLNSDDIFIFTLIEFHVAFLSHFFSFVVSFFDHLIDDLSLKRVKKKIWLEWGEKESSIALSHGNEEASFVYDLSSFSLRSVEKSTRNMDDMETIIKWWFQKKTIDLRIVGDDERKSSRQKVNIVRCMNLRWM